MSFIAQSFFCNRFVYTVTFPTVRLKPHRDTLYIHWSILHPSLFLFIARQPRTVACMCHGLFGSVNSHTGTQLHAWLGRLVSWLRNWMSTYWQRLGCTGSPPTVTVQTLRLLRLGRETLRSNTFEESGLREAGPRLWKPHQGSSMRKTTMICKAKKQKKKSRNCEVEKKTTL